ncbi:MAG: AEC family transporter [Phormidesmis sp. RL_2_1]|nr:AEC family transporter [Phormidesmis sp. RL_2_1]
MGVLISAVLPIALVALCGLCVGRAFALDLKTLARINIYALLPALVLTGVYSSRLAVSSVVGIVLGFLLNCALLYLIAQHLGRALNLPLDRRKSLVATTLLANSGNIGLPFVLFSLGEAALARAVVYLIASAIFITSVGPIFLKGEGIGAGLKVTLNLPVFWATFAGIALQIFAWSVPVPIDRALTLLSEAAIPVALLMLGVQLSQTSLKFGRYELFAASLRLLVSPLSAYGIGRLLGLQGLDLSVLVVQSAMPVAINTLIWVTEFGGDTVRVAKTIVVSTLLSFVSLPMVLWLVNR